MKDRFAITQWRVYIIGHSLVSLAFASTLILLNGKDLFTSLLPLGIIALLSLAANGIYYYLWKSQRINFLSTLAVCLEIALNTVLIFTLGPSGWVFAFAYLWPLIMGGWLISPHAVLPLTLYTMLGYGTVFTANLLGFTPNYELRTIASIEQAVVLAMPQLAFVAILLWRFMEQLASSQRELKKEHDLLDGVLHNMSDAVAVSQNGRYILTNREATRLIQAQVGSPVAAWLYPGIPTSSEPVRDGYRMVKHNRWTLGINAVLLDSCTIWVLRDATEQERYLQLQNDFLAYASHELRTPLTTIKLHLRMLELDNKSALCTQSIHAIRNEVDRQTRLVNDLLDMTRIEAGKYEPKMQSTRPYQLCRQIITRFKPLASEKGLDLRLSLSDDPSPTVTSDPVGIERILCNLMTNALKFTDGGYIELTCAPNGQDIQFTVSDTGCGLNKEQTSHLFEKFYTAGKPGGTGLGLVIARMTAETLGGTLVAESALGEGSCFTLRLPSKPDTI